MCRAIIKARQGKNFTNRSERTIKRLDVAYALKARRSFSLFFLIKNASCC